MRFASFITAAALTGAAFTATTAMAEESGQALYMDACASCHGTAAMGDGPMAAFMSVNVPSLQDLSQNNDGVFPMLEVIHIIDGRTGVRGHGSEMPVWGRQFKGEMLDAAGIYGSEIYARGKVLSLAYYLETIQSE
ncbi:cytochrome c [Yoonia sp.]|uniref:c-type cytochrome n=1 Tax=Yoonia sp. TaxID=2212373 RepID=UPI00358E266B